MEEKKDTKIEKIEEPLEKIYKIKDGCYLNTASLFNEPAIFYPVRDLETGKFNWRNFLIGGSWSRFLGLVLVIIILLGVIWAYKHDTATCFEIIRNPCKYCFGAPYDRNDSSLEFTNETLQEIQKGKHGQMIPPRAG